MPPIEAILVEALVAAVAGAFYGLVWFGRNRAKKANPENFSRSKFFATLIIAGVVGGVIGASGGSVGFEDVETKLAAYGFIVVIVEGLLKTVWEFRPASVDWFLGS